mgnify:CR=1 FL=1
MAEQTLRPGDQAPDLEVDRADGTPLALAALWRERPAPLVFLRHYG